MATAGAVDSLILSYAPPRAKSTRTTNTGFSSHTLARLCSSRLARIHTQTTKTSRAGGQTHPNASTTESGAMSTITPATAIKIAGATAQRCDCSVNRVDSTANSAHPNAKPKSTIAVEKFTSTVPTGRNGRTTAATNPAASDPGTTPPRCLRRDPGPTAATPSAFEVSAAPRWVMTDRLTFVGATPPSSSMRPAARTRNSPNGPTQCQTSPVMPLSAHVLSHTSP